MNDCCTDVIHLTYEQRKELFHLWSSQRSENNFIPADLFFANTLPLKHFMVITPNNSNACEAVRYHVLPEEEQEIYEDNSKLVMTVETWATDYEVRGFYFGVLTKEGHDGLMSSMIFIKNFETGDLEGPISEDDENYERVCKITNQMILTWYGIEIALLHPTVKEIFQHPRIKKERIAKKERIHNDNKVYTYVRHHFIDTDELKESIFGKGAYNRKALIWYVTGHWRTYKTGRTIFIQPYWKGALRETKTANPRTREIVMPTV